MILHKQTYKGWGEKQMKINSPFKDEVILIFSV